MEWPDVEVLGTVAEWVAGVGTILTLGAAVWAVRMQGKELALQRTELQLQREELEQSVEAQQELARLEGERLAAELTRTVATARALIVDVPLQLDLGTRALRLPSSKDLTLDAGSRAVVPSHDLPFAELYVPVRNIGSGTAFITSTSISTGPGYSCSGDVLNAIVPPNEVSGIVFSVPHDRDELAPLVEAISSRSSSVSVFAAYTNSAGGDALRTCLHLAKDDDHQTGMRVRQVTVLDAESGNVVVQSGPADARLQP